MKILLLTASDNQHVKMFTPSLVRILEQAGHTVSMADSTRQALGMIASCYECDLMLYHTVHSQTCTLPTEADLLHARGRNPVLRVVIFTTDVKAVPKELGGLVEVVHKSSQTGLEDLLAAVANQATSE